MTTPSSTKAPLKLKSSKDAKEFIDKFDVFLIDCDGVLWQGDKLLSKVKETLELLRSHDKKIVFVTNNSTKSRRMYLKKFGDMGIPAKTDEIFGSAYSSAVYLKEVVKLPSDKRVYVIGEGGIEEELASEGVSYFGGTDAADRRAIEPKDYETIKSDDSVGCVLCGLDTHINYLKIAKAMAYLENKDTLFLCTNFDSTYPTHNKLFPGAGTSAAPLIYLTNRQPTSLGKPAKEMMDCITAKFDFDRSRTCMIGDRLDTDILFGKNGGLGGTLLVLTGVNKEKDILDPQAEILPDYYAEQLGDVYTLIKG